MKNSLLLISTSILSALLSSCSSIDSTKPFDQDQAQKIIQEFFVTKPAQHMVALALPRDLHWKRVGQANHTLGSSITLVPQNESLTNWTESIRTKSIAYESNANMKANKFVQLQIANAKKDCKQVDAKILEQNTNWVIYKLDINGCTEDKNQMQIGKAFNGNDAVYLVYYSAATGQISATQFNRMSSVIENAQLVGHR